MIKCVRCQGKVFVDLTFTENKNYETFCLRCGDRKFIGFGDEYYVIINSFVRSALQG